MLPWSVRFCTTSKRHRRGKPDTIQIQECEGKVVLDGRLKSIQTTSILEEAVPVMLLVSLSLTL